MQTGRVREYLPAHKLTFSQSVRADDSLFIGVLDRASGLAEVATLRSGSPRLSRRALGHSPAGSGGSVVLDWAGAYGGLYSVSTTRDWVSSVVYVRDGRPTFEARLMCQPERAPCIKLDANVMLGSNASGGLWVSAVGPSTADPDTIQSEVWVAGDKSDTEGLVPSAGLPASMDVLDIGIGPVASRQVRGSHYSLGPPVGFWLPSGSHVVWFVNSADCLSPTVWTLSTGESMPLPGWNCKWRSGAMLQPAELGDEAILGYVGRERPDAPGTLVVVAASASEASLVATISLPAPPQGPSGSSPVVSSSGPQSSVFGWGEAAESGPVAGLLRCDADGCGRVNVAGWPGCSLVGVGELDLLASIWSCDDGSLRARWAEVPDKHVDP